VSRGTSAGLHNLMGATADIHNILGGSLVSCQLFYISTLVREGCDPAHRGLMGTCQCSGCLALVVRFNQSPLRKFRHDPVINLIP